jgi:hypothetical protein
MIAPSRKPFFGMDFKIVYPKESTFEKTVLRSGIQDRASKRKHLRENRSSERDSRSCIQMKAPSRKPFFGAGFKIVYPNECTFKKAVLRNGFLDRVSIKIRIKRDEFPPGNEK